MSEQVPGKGEKGLDHVDNPGIAQLVIDKRAVALHFDQKRAFQLLQVVGYQRLREV